jgi:hypothetical protein
VWRLTWEQVLLNEQFERLRGGNVITTTVATASATKPAKSEFLPYYDRYISLVPDGDVISTLATQINETQALLRGLPASVATYRYAPDNWSLNELIGHIIDS